MKREKMIMKFRYFWLTGYLLSVGVFWEQIPGTLREAFLYNFVLLIIWPVALGQKLAGLMG